MIDISKLTEKDIGRWVIYKAHGCKPQLGKIKSYGTWKCSKRYIFVVYKCAGNWNDFKEYTEVATKPKDLQFCETLGEPTKDEILYKGRDYDSSVKEVNEIEDE